MVADIYLIRLECESDSNWFTEEIRSKLDNGSSVLPGRNGGLMINLHTRNFQIYSGWL